MPITTTDQLSQYLLSKGVPTAEIAPLTGGSSNFVWRITDFQGQCSIIKHAEPFLAGNHGIPFPVERMDLEVLALELIPTLIPKDDLIVLPTVLWYDKEEHVLCFEDMGDRTLHNAYHDPNVDVKKIGEAMGGWLARLHASTTNSGVKRKFDNPTAKRMYRWNYNNLSSVLLKYGFEGTLGERINARYGALLETDDECVCHTDLFPGNILLKDVNQPPEQKKLRVAVIDWEVTRMGNGVTDVGHFAGEAWFLDRFRGARGLLQAFLSAYVQGKALREEDRKRYAVHFGARIVFWPTIYKWIADEHVEGCVRYGNEVLERVERKDWEWFRNGDLAVLFEGLDTWQTS